MVALHEVGLHEERRYGHRLFPFRGGLFAERRGVGASGLLSSSSMRATLGKLASRFLGSDWMS